MNPICIPFTVERLLDFARFFSSYEGTCLLLSGGHLDSAERSFLALFPEKEWNILGKESMHQKNPWDVLKEHLGPLDVEGTYIPQYFGFLCYEMGIYADTALKLPHYRGKLPDAYFMKASIVASFDHQTGKLSLYFTKVAPKEYATEEFWREFDIPQKEERDSPPLHLLPREHHLESYTNMLNEAKKLIFDGEIYQVNLSQELNCESTIDSFDLFEKIYNLNPSPFMAYMRVKEGCIVSSSPERFLKKEGYRLETRPIKGTAPRGKDRASDEHNRQELLSSEKERAELLMITDLMRNDLGKVSVAGSVSTDAIWRCEAYTNVFHLISVIRSQVKASLHPVDIIRSCFPGGSITGCPKLRALEVIAALEKRARGIYTGSIGYFTGQGDFDFNIAIRTVFIDDQTLNIQLGGGIVADSIPEQEYAETLYKGASILQVLHNQTSI